MMMANSINYCTRGQMKDKIIQKRLDNIIDKLDGNLDFFNNDSELCKIRDMLQGLWEDIQKRSDESKC